MARLQPGSRYLDRLRHTPDSFVLTDDSRLETRFEVEQAVALLTARRLHGNAGTRGDDFRDHGGYDHRRLPHLIAIILLRGFVFDGEDAGAGTGFVEDAASFVGQG